MNFNDKVRAMALRLIGNNNAEKEALEPKLYVARLTQASTDPPVAEILRNTLGVIPEWSYEDEGEFELTSIGAFPQGKVNIIPGANLSPEIGNILFSTAGNDNKVYLKTQDATYAEANDLLDMIVKIEVYP